jgi:hypothetical protein
MPACAGAFGVRVGTTRCFLRRAAAGLARCFQRGSEIVVSYVRPAIKVFLSVMSCTL